MIRKLALTTMIVLALAPAAAEARRHRAPRVTLQQLSVPAPSQGPDIALGKVAGDTVEVLTLNARSPFVGFNLHLRAQPSAGVAVTTITVTNGTVLSGTALCYSAHPANEVIQGCTTIPATLSNGAGLLATARVIATGDGCVALRLVEDASAQAALLDTFTIYIAPFPGQAVAQAQMQSNGVSAAPAFVLVGAGTTGDCPAA